MKKNKSVFIKVIKQYRVMELILMLLLCFFITPSTVHAKAKVSKVVGKRYSYMSDGDYYQYTVIQGKSKKGKSVWKYTTSKCAATELSSASWKEKGKYVYVIDNHTFLRINKQTGKVVSKKRIKPSYVSWGNVLYVDGSGNLYCMGYYGRYVIKFNSKGTVKWARKIKSNYFWPYKMKLSGKRLTVYFESNGGKVTLNSKTGKVISYAKGRY